MGSDRDYVYRRQAVQSKSAAVVHEGLTPGAVPNDGPQLAKGEGALTGKVGTNFSSLQLLFWELIALRLPISKKIQDPLCRTP